MASEEETDQLKLFWEYFFKAETGTYEKSTWLDLFLAEFLIRVNDGCNPKELIKFCPISGVVSLIGCELLCGIHRVSSAINTHCTSPLPTLDPLPGVPEEDRTDHTEKERDDNTRTGLFTRANAQSSSEKLRKYLLGGVAWKCLVLLKALGVEGMSCCRQLSSVLIWLYGEAGGEAEEAAPNPYVRRLTQAQPMHQLFSNRIWSKHKLSGQGSKTPLAEKTAHVRSKKISQIKTEETQSPRRKIAKTSEESSETPGSVEDLQVLNKSLSIKVSTPEDDFRYFNSPLTSLTDPNVPYDIYYSPRKSKPKADDFTTDKHKAVLNSEISSFDFSLLITDLLKELCRAESSLSGSEGSQISVHCISFSLRNLCSLQFGSLPACSVKYSAPQVSTIKLSLTELLIVSLDKVLLRSDLCAKLINNGILPMLLRILEDVIYKSSSKFHKKTDKNISKTDDKLDRNESENLLKFVFGIAYCVAAFFYCLLTQCRTVDKLREFTDQFKLYGECLKGASLKECIELMMRLPEVQTEAIILVKKLIEAVGKLIWAMKRVRSEVIHSAACPRSRHKACRQRVTAGMHHHHDILGESSTDLPLASTCCISVLYATLATLLVDEEVSNQSVLRNKILRVMLNCGVCCCFSPGFLMENIVKLMLTHHPATSLCLQVLEHTIYGELGASVLVQKVTDQLPCSVCEPNENTRDSNRKYYGQGVGGVERKSIISFLIHYNSLLQLDNHNDVLHATVSHLQRITPKCRSEVKYELLFSVIYPTFIVAKHRYVIRLEEASYFLTISCLNIFANLLNSVSFAEQFIQKGGLSYVLELVSIPEFSEQCCSILEIAITVEIFKLIRDQSDMTYFRDMNSLSSVQMLIKSLTNATDKCYKIYKMKLPPDTFNELCDISREREALSVQTRRRESEQFQVRKINTPKSIRMSYAAAVNTTEENLDDYIDVLKNACTFWKSCAGLCLYSPMYRKWLVEEAVFLDSYCMLKVVLHCLQQEDTGAAEVRVLIKILEALLTIQFAVSDVTSERSKAVSCDVLRAGLSHNGAANADLRALCDALVRVATRAPSITHTMPPVTVTKLPPLAVSDSGPLERCSSEETVSEPYASDRSDRRLDPGYEADVEICKLEQLSPTKTKKATAACKINSTLSLAESLLGDLEVECATYTSGGTVAHPELCTVVFDILTKIIKTVVECEPGRARVAAGVGVGVCGRAAAALAGGAGGAGGALHALLRAAAPILPNPGEHVELHRSILDLFHVLATQSITPAELSHFLSIVLEAAASAGRAEAPADKTEAAVDKTEAPVDKTEAPVDKTEAPVDKTEAPADKTEAPAGRTEAPALAALLEALLKLMDDKYDAPRAVLTFPITADLPMDKVPPNFGNVPGQQAEGVARKLREQHLQNGVVSCWSRHACRGGVEGASWAPWLQGFALALWILRPDCTDTSSESGSRELSHVVSVGHASLMFELWMHVETGSLTVRLCRPEGGSNKVVCECVCVACVPAARWSCLAVQLSETLRQRRAAIQVTIYVNGLPFETFSLPIQGILVRKVSPSNILVGHASPAGDRGRGRPAWHVCALKLLRQPALDTYGALALTAAGYRTDLFHTAMVDNMLPNYAVLLTPELLDSNLDWDQVFDTSGSVARQLQDKLLLSFNAYAPHHFNLYHQTATPMSGAGSTAVPEAAAATWAGTVSGGVRRGVHTTMLTLAAPELLDCLTHKVLESTADGRCYALAVALQLRGRARHPRGHTIHTHTIHTLPVIFSAACSMEVLSVRGSRTMLHTRTQAAILHPELLLFPLDINSQQCSWELDTGEIQHGSLWTLALSAICCLLHENNKRRDFNRYQLERGNFAEHLFMAVKELVLISEEGTPPALVSAVLGAGGALVGGAPNAHASELLQLLLLMHQASDTFVTHSRSDFYFLLSSEMADINEFSLFNFMNKNKSLRRSKKKSNSVPIPNAEVKSVQTHMTSSVTSDDVSTDRSDVKLLTVNQHALDPTKEIKGLVNMQLRDGRKHNASLSISENSEDTSGHSEEFVVHEPSLGDPSLGEYVVVSTNDITEQLKHEEENADGFKKIEESGWELYEAFASLLHDVIKQMPQQQVSAIIQPEVLLVLANHRSSVARASIVRALAACSHLLHQQHRLIHLAHQISLYECSRELAEACVTLITQVEGTLEEQARAEVWLGVSEQSLALSPPLLAVLPRTFHDQELALDVFRIIEIIVDKASLKQISELAIPETLSRAVVGLGSRGAGVAPLWRAALLVASRVATRAAVSHHHMQTLLEVHYLLQYVELSDLELESPGVWSVSRQLQAALYDVTLKCLEERLHSAKVTHSTANYFTSVLTSVTLSGDSISRSELLNRYRAYLTRAVNFIVERRPTAVTDAEVRLVDTLTTTLLDGYTSSLRNEAPSLLSGVVRWALSPLAAQSEVQPRMLATLAARGQPPHLDNPHQLSVFVVTSVARAHENKSLPLSVTDWARAWALSLGGAGGGERPPAAALPHAAARYAARDAAHAAAQAAKAAPTIHRAVFRWESVTRAVCDSAMAATRLAVEQQNAARKAFLSELRQTRAKRAAHAADTRRLARHFTHERAVFHQASTYPVSWQLDACEGPGRVRLRLRRAHLPLPRRFFKPDHRHKTELAMRAAQSRMSTVGRRGGRAAAGAGGARLRPGEVAVHAARCLYVTVDRDTEGDLLLTDRAIHFVPDDPPDPDEGPSPPATSPAMFSDPAPEHTWPLDSITAICTRRWCLRERAVEVFVVSGHAHLVALPAQPERAAFLAHAHALTRAVRSEQEALADATALWRQGAITNWDYLMRLNDLAGRTYNDLMQYPVLPFVIADYTSKILDLTEYKSFRDLAKPMAIQNKNREQHYINTYNDLKAALESGSSSTPPHHYASLYSNSGAVLHYLVRMPPFTQLFLNYQDNNFDMPDRTFHSLATTWRLITKDSPTDVKEMIPELFYLPDLFYNNEGLNFGIRQCGAAVDDVELPPWAADARIFTLIHRQALEASIVTERLPAWIDLVFGYKQLGREAKLALNVFPACTYYGFDPSSLSDEVERRAAEAMVRTYGQAPRQLFHKPHPAAGDMLPPTQEPSSPSSIWAGVVGGRWGAYCGSPALPQPTVVARRALAAAQLQPVNAPRTIVATHAKTLMHVGHGGGVVGVGGGAGCVGAACVLSWCHVDGVARVRRRVSARDVLAAPLLPAHTAHDHDITIMSTSCLLPGCPIIVGTRCGLVYAILSSNAPDAPTGPPGASGSPFLPRSVPMLGHNDVIVDIKLCPAQGILVTASRDGLILLWDLHELTYIRTLPNRDMLPVTHAAISETLADIATVHDLSTRRNSSQKPNSQLTPNPHSQPPPVSCESSGSDSYEQDSDNFESLIRVHTVNGRFVGHVKVVEKVTSVCYSNAPEGVSVNVVCAGLCSGGVRLYSAWELRPLAHVSPHNHTPALSICYSINSDVLFTCHADGVVLAWESHSGSKPQPAKIIAAHTLL